MTSRCRPCRKYGSIGVAANLLLGYFAAAINLVITMPVEVASPLSSRFTSPRKSPNDSLPGPSGMHSCPDTRT